MMSTPDALPPAPAPAPAARRVDHLNRFLAMHADRSVAELPALACEFWFDALLESAPLLRPARAKVLAHLVDFWKA